MKEQILLILAALFLSVFLLGLNLEFQSQRDSYYTMKFKENQIDRITGKSLEELSLIGEDLRDYLKVGKNALLESHFNQEEVSHMIDVYKLFTSMRKLMIGSLLFAIFTIYFAFKNLGCKRGLSYLGRGFCLVLMGLLLCIAIVSLDFNRAFILFHRLLFTNELWLMDPETDLMIQMLPQNFFSDMAANIAKGTLFMVSLFALLGFIPIKKENKNGIK